MGSANPNDVQPGQESALLRARIEELERLAEGHARTTAALREEQRLLDSIITHIPSGVYWKGRDFRYRGCNNAFARSAGVERPADIVGKTDYELAWEKQQADYFRACDRRVMEEHRALLNIEEQERQADGRQAILLTSKVPLLDESGHTCGVLGIDTDISELKRVENELRQARAELELRVRERTRELSAANEQLRHEIRDRERAEQALRLSEERYRLVSELTSDYAYSFHVMPDGTCRAEWLTQAFARISGHSPSELESGDWSRIAHPDDGPIIERRRRSLLAGRSIVSEFRILTDDGRIRWLRDHARPVWDEAEHRVLQILGAAQDVTERKQAEEEARCHQTAMAQVARLTTMGELAAQLAHELNQPLCTMIGNAQTAQRLLAMPVPDLAELGGALDDIVTFGNQAATVIRRLRDFLRHQQPQPVLLNVQRMIEEVATFIEAEARQHSARVLFGIADDLPVIRGDPIQLQQVLLNLVRNGLEALEPGQEHPHEVMITADYERSQGVHIRVSDTGRGLDAQTLGRLFEPFFTTKPSGLGLGLPMCRSIVESHRGRLWAQAGHPRGTTFSLLLPTVDEEPSS